MLESGGDDNIIFNKWNIPKIITITKERTSIGKIPENVIIINKGNNKIHLNLEQKSNKINRDEIMNSLKKIKNIQIESEDVYYDEQYNKKNNISPYKYVKSSQNKLIKISKNDFIKDNLYSNVENTDRINIMKKKMLKKEKEEILSEDNYNKFNVSELFEKNIDTKLYSNKLSERISLQSSNSINSNSNSNRYLEKIDFNKNNYNEIKKDTNENLGKKLNLNINTKELTRNKTLNIEKMNSTNLITNIINIVKNLSVIKHIRFHRVVNA